MNAVKEESFLASINSDVSWTSRIFVVGICVQIKLDTGADITPISKTVYCAMLRSSP